MFRGDLVIGHPHSLFVGLPRRRPHDSDVIVTMLRAGRVGCGLGVGIAVLWIGPVAGLIHLITHDGTGYGTDTRTDEGTLALMAGLVADDGTETGTQRTTEEGTILRGGRITTGENKPRQQYRTKC